MRTEETDRRTRVRDPHEVSRALQELAPGWALEGRRGRPVPLTSAGYLLRFGQSYRLRLASPFPGDEIGEVRIINPPAFVSVEPTLREEDERGQSVFVLPFKVHLDLWTNLRRLGISVCGDELEVVHYFKPGNYRQVDPFLCPIVVRPRWVIVLAAVIGSLFLMLVERLLTALFTLGGHELDLASVTRSLRQGYTWEYFLAVAVGVWAVVNLVNVGLLYRRSRELRGIFRESYPSV